MKNAHLLLVKSRGHIILAACNVARASHSLRCALTDRL
jgi:hypothetical protein